jgi:hypothetical protein
MDVKSGKSETQAFHVKSDYLFSLVTSINGLLIFPKDAEALYDATVQE